MAKLTTAARKKLPKSDFAIPSKRAYPMPDKNHARVAKARVAEYGTPAEKAAVDAKANKILGKEGTARKRGKAKRKSTALKGMDVHAAHIEKLMG